jgi:hypothetical protein
MLPFYSLDQLKDPEVVKMCDTHCNTINAGDDKRNDLPLFHEYQGGAGEGAAVDGAKVGVHDLTGSVLENSRFVAFEQAAGVASGTFASVTPAVGRLHSHPGPQIVSAEGTL